MSFQGISKFIGRLFILGIIGIICTIFFSIYLIYTKTGVQTYETKTKVQPEIKLETDGKKIDTIYVYKFK